LEQALGDLQNLRGGFALGVDDLGESFAERAMGVDLGEAQLGDWRCLKGAQDLVGADFAGKQARQQL